MQQELFFFVMEITTEVTILKEQNRVSPAHLSFATDTKWIAK